MGKSLCKVLKNTPEDTPIMELMVNGEDVSRVDNFVRYDEDSGLAYFNNEDGSQFVAVADRIDMIEFAGSKEQKKKEKEEKKKSKGKNKDLANIILQCILLQLLSDKCKDKDPDKHGKRDKHDKHGKRK